MSLHQLIGIGLRHPHYKQILTETPEIGWLEVHSENFFTPGGPTIDFLTKIREHYPLSLHGIGLSLGSADGISASHLKTLKELISQTSPFLVSEHLSWSMIDGVYMPDLLPVPYTQESFDAFKRNINQAQDVLGRNILIENPSSYLEYKISDQEEADFLVNLCQDTGAGMLLDVNNVFVSCENHGWNAKTYLDKIPAHLVQEIHLAGHDTKQIADNKILRVDTHNDFVCPEVWDLYEYTVEKIGPKHTLLEWDSDYPSLETLMKEAHKATSYFPEGAKYAAL